MSETKERWRKRRERLRILRILPRGTEHLRRDVTWMLSPKSKTLSRPSNKYDLPAAAWNRSFTDGELSALTSDRFRIEVERLSGQ
jgi:hypothetical protein